MADWAKAERAAARLSDGNYEDAARLYEELGDNGHADSQVFIGWMYSQGIGVAKDDVKANQWFLRAANSGSVKGMFYAGRMSIKRGNPQEAFHWYSRSAAGHFFPADFWLGECFRRGLGTETNNALASKHYRIAAAHGHVFSRRALALQYLSGSSGMTNVLAAIPMLIVAIVDGAVTAIRDPHSERLLI